MKDFDIIIIGAGAVGCAIARELSRYKLNICVLEKNNDVVCETSGRNSGVLHAGINNTPGSLMARFCVNGNKSFENLAKELSVPFKRTGKVIIGFDASDRERLDKMLETGRKNNVPGLRIIEKAELSSIAPNIMGEFALYSPSTGIFDPFRLTIALAENAAKNRVKIVFNASVNKIDETSTGYSLKTESGTSFTCRYIINSAGLSSAKIAKMLNLDRYTIHPCRGEYFVLDKSVGKYLDIPAYPVPNPTSGGLGIHLTPTIDGNILIGPSNEYIDSFDDYSSTANVMDMLIREGRKIFPLIKREHFIRNFSGIRPKLTSKDKGGYHDFVIEESGNSLNLIGIESPGMTSAYEIGKYVSSIVSEKFDADINPNFDPYLDEFTIFRDKTTEEKAALIRNNPNYGEIICRCEQITKAEILNAINNPLGADSLSAVKYRCRAMMGKCQGGFCHSRITELIEKEKEKPFDEILYKNAGSYIFNGTVCNDD